MQFKSPLSNLSETLMQIQESAKVYRSTLIKNEAATRAVLIDPVLRSLGWDTANTTMVEVEKTMDSVRADYALNDGNEIPRIIVEAKALGTDLDQKRLVMSLVNYAFSFGLNDVFLTDGIIWEHFDNFQPGNLLPSKTLNLATDKPVECAAYFVQHLDAAKYWPVGQSIDVISQRIDELENLVANLQKKIQSITENVPSSVERKQNLVQTSQESFTLLSELEEIAGKKPSRFRLPNGEVLDINTWKDILRESCKFTLAHNFSIPVPFPDRVGKKVSLFSFEKPANKVSFITETYNGQKIYIYLNYDSFNCIENALY
ncbi:MAG: hypothetical protein AAGU75_23295, partial [Bacillota bacterium]